MRAASRVLIGRNTAYSEQQIAVAKSAGNLLEVISELPLGNLCFSNAKSQIKVAQGRLTIITLAGLTLPSASTDQDRYTYAQRLSVTLLYLVTHYSRSLVTDPLYTGPKALIIDEAWAITQTSQGAQLVAEVARLGRSRNTALILVSQNARDLLAEDVKNCLTTMFVFRSEDPSEIAADLELLRVSDNPEHRNAIASLPTGRDSECIMRDIRGHVGTMRVDMSYLPDVTAAFDSTPGEDTGHVQSAARRIVTDGSWPHHWGRRHRRRSPADRALAGSMGGVPSLPPGTGDGEGTVVLPPSAIPPLIAAHNAMAHGASTVPPITVPSEVRRVVMPSSRVGVSPTSVEPRPPISTAPTSSATAKVVSSSPSDGHDGTVYGSNYARVVEPVEEDPDKTQVRPPGPSDAAGPWSNRE